MFRTLMAALGTGALGLIVTVADPAADASATGRETNDVGFNTVRLETGVRLHYAEQGPAEGETVVMLHGYSDSW